MRRNPAEFSESELSGGAAPEDVGLADVAAGHLGAGVAELSLDGALVAIVHRDRGVAATQAMAGVAGRVEARSLGGAFDDQGVGSGYVFMPSSA